MTPRSLLTAIGATAVAFALAIGVAASGTFDTVLPAGTAAVAIVDGYQLAPALYVGNETDGVAGARLAFAAWNDPCVTAM